MQEKILLTGVAGFIASRTAEKLLDQGYFVVGVDNVNDYYDVKLKDFRIEKLQQHKSVNNFEFHRLDIENMAGLEVLFKKHKFSSVINLAARAGVRYSTINPHVYMTTNANGTLNIMELMRKHKVEKMVLASTSSLYAGQKMPFKEDLAVNEPISPYAASKKAAEVMAYSYHFLFDLDISIVRYFTVFGPAGRPDMCMFRFIKWIDEGSPIELFGDGSQSRDFTYVDDIAEGTIKATKRVGYEVMNLGGGNNPIDLNYIIRGIEDRLGKKAKIDQKPWQKADIMATWADISKAEKLLGWKPEISVEEGITRTVEWYKENKGWLKNVKL